jgi:hypothetical protein
MVWRKPVAMNDTRRPSNHDGDHLGGLVVGGRGAKSPSVDGG